MNIENRSPQTSPPGAVNLGPWVIDAAGRRVSGPGGTRRLEPKAMALLLELAARPGEVVSRRELLAAGWGDEMATDDVLSRAVSEVRRALGDDPRNPSIIETIRGSGYRLVVNGTEAAGETASVEPAETRAPPVAPAAIPGKTRRYVTVAYLGPTLVLVSLGAIVAVRRPAVDETRWVLAPLTSLPGEEGMPRLSPDGTRVLYTSRDSASGAARLVVEGVAGSNRVTLAEGDVRYPAWSPDGARVVFARRDSLGWTITEVPSLGGFSRQLARADGPLLPGLDWSWDGRTVAYSTHPRPFAPFRVHALDTSSLAIREITTGGGTSVGDLYPAYTPDGRQLVVARYTGETSSDIVVVDVVTGTESRVTSDGNAVTAIAVQPDGRSILYASEQEGTATIWSVRLDGGGRLRLIDTDRVVTGLSHSRSNDVIVAALAERTQNLWRIDVGGGTAAAERFLPTTRVDGLARFSPDDANVAFVSTRSGSAELWVASRDGRAARQLTNLGRVAGVPSWAPDQSRIAIQRHIAGGASIWLVDAIQGTAQVLRHNLGEVAAPEWSRDGQSILASAKASGRWEIWRIPLDGGEPERLTKNGGLRARESADGHLYFTKASTPGLWERAANGEERLVVTSVAQGDWTNWDIAGRAAVYVRNHPAGGQQVVWQSLDSADVRVLTTGVRVPLGTGGVAVSGDGRAVLFGQLHRREGDIYRLVRR